MSDATNSGLNLKAILKDKYADKVKNPATDGSLKSKVRFGKLRKKFRKSAVIK